VPGQRKSGAGGAGIEEPAGIEVLARGHGFGGRSIVYLF